MKAKINYNVGIYCRLSREDGEGESNSITNQKAFISEYIIKRGYNIYKIYVDDGYTGTSFNRPSFKEMINDIENGLVDLVITKDLSRLGRDYINAGYYIEEYFPRHNVRYIAINDNYDSINSEGDDFVPLKNVINEFYAKDISKKVRATKSYYQRKGIQRKTAYPIYGYTFNEEGQRIINIETALVVKRIYQEFVINRKTISTIAKILKQEKIYRPSYYNYITYGKRPSSTNLKQLEQTKYDWKYHSIEAILSTLEYTGTYITSKTKKISFKIKIQKETPKEERYYFENSFEPIISKDLFEQAQDYRMRYKNSHKALFDETFRGLCYCAHCHNKMHFHSKNNLKRITNIYCEVKNCSIRPKITADFLKKVIFYELKKLKEYIYFNESAIVEYVKERKFLEEKNDDLEKQELEYLQKEYEKYNKFLKKLFELYATDSMTLEEYNIRTKEYHTKQEELQNKIDELMVNKIDNTKRNFEKETEQIINIFKSYKLDSEEDLTEELISSLIKRIYIAQEKQTSFIYVNKDINIIIEYRYADEVFKGFMYGKQITNQQYSNRNICKNI